MYCYKNFQKHITDKTINKSIFINNFIKQTKAKIHRTRAIYK